MHTRTSCPTTDERRRCLRVVWRLLAEEKARRFALCRLYEDRDERHESAQSALIEEIRDSTDWIARFRRAADRLLWQADKGDLPPRQDRRAA